MEMWGGLWRDGDEPGLFILKFIRELNGGSVQNGGRRPKDVILYLVFFCIKF